MARAHGQSTRSNATGRLLRKTAAVNPSGPRYFGTQARNRRVTMAINDVIGVLLIVALLAVVLWRIFEVRLDHKNRKKVDDTILDNERNKMDDDV